MQQQTFEREVDASEYLLRLAATPAGQAYKTLALRHLSLSRGETVIDLGCGPGTDLRRYAEAVGSDGRVVGVDIDETALMHARERTTDLPQVQVWSADIRALDLASGSVDAVHTDRVLQHVPDPSTALAEATRILKPGGRAVFAEPDWRTLVIDHAESRLAEAFTRYVVEHQVRNSRIGVALPHLCRDAGLSVAAAIPVTTVFDSLSAADRVLGFERVTRRAVEHGFLTDSEGRRWLDGLAADWTCGATTLFVVAASKGSESESHRL